MRPTLTAGLALAVGLAVGCRSSTAVTTSPSPQKCQVAVSAPQGSLNATGGSATVTISTEAECAWTAAASVSWITGLTPTSGQGNGQVQFQVSANTSAVVREGDIMLNDQHAHLTQAGLVCAVTVSPSTLAVQSSGGSGSVSVSAANGCTWAVTSQAPWIQVTSGANGAASGSFAFSVTSNSGAARTGSVTVADQTFQITQSAAPAVPPTCTYSLGAISQAVSAAGGTVTTSLTAPTGCAWTATPGAAWITIASGASGSGNGSINATIAPNIGPTRVGTFAVAGQTFTVTQANGCAYAMDSTGQSIGSAGGAGSPIGITTAAGCAWTATTGDAWLTITSGASGSGNGSVNFTAATSSGPTRTGAITVAGQVFTVTQGSGCAYSINPGSQSIASGGGAGSAIAVTTATGCTWTATAVDSWLTITSGSSGTGNGTVNFTIASTSGPTRIGTLTVAGQTFTVTEGAGCAYAINPSSQSIGSAGGAGTAIAVTTSNGCAWTATANDSWLTVTSGASGSGNGTVNFTAASTSGPTRTGTLTVAGRTFTVTQATGCSYSINPSSQSIGSSGGAGTPIAVTATAGCTWTATTTDTWLTVTSGASGTGNGTVNFTIAATSGPPRTGTLTVAGKTFIVNQGNGCAYAINPTSQSIASAGGAGSAITVTTAAGCAWTATTTDAWLSINSGSSSGSGNGTVNFTIASNSGPSRTGTLTVAGQAFTVNQGSGCTYGINPTSQSIGAAGGAGSAIAVTTANLCTWTATTTDAWLTIPSGSSSGTGNGTVNFTIAANTTPGRTGTLTVAGQTFTVTQANGCTYAINPTSQNFSKNAGTSSPINVTTGAGCTWTATTTDTWITITPPGSGTGSGSFTLSVLANPGPNRTGTVSIGGQTFTVTQQHN